MPETACLPCAVALRQCPCAHRLRAFALPLLAVGCAASAAQLDITAPGSVAFGSSVRVLPNGNVVVTDPSGPTANIGIVYLYTPGGTKISSFTGSSANDQVGSGGVTVLPSGNFLVVSPHWSNGAAANAGAVTWVDGSTGLNGVVSAANSLVGTSAGDQVGRATDPVAPPYDSVADYSVRVLANGNFVVRSVSWNNGAATNAGAVTFGRGSSATVGAVSAANSLVGTHDGDQVGGGGAIALRNGHAVVLSPAWSSAAAAHVGAVTWFDGTQGLTGAVAASNSLVGLSANDQVGSGGLTQLANGNYVVASPCWSNGAAACAGAATWLGGAAPTSAIVSPANSLVGSTTNDQVGLGGIAALTNGNYVVLSTSWNNGAATAAGAATWGDGRTGTSGGVAAANSLVGASSGDAIGNGGAFALSNGNYVVASYSWSSGGVASVGAATWGSGTSGVSGAVSAANSLVGGSAYDQVGNLGVVALSNGNYVVPTVFWADAAGNSVGAVTWGDGSAGVSGAVSASNSLVGSHQLDLIGSGGVYALANGNFIVDSPNWGNAGVTRAGAITWANGSTGAVGAVTSANSLVGTQTNDRIGSGYVTALADGNAVASSPNWSNGAATGAGAVTWLSGGGPTVGTVSAANSLVGTGANDAVGSFTVALNNGALVTWTPSWNNPATAATAAGAVTWLAGNGPLVGEVSPANSLVGTSTNDALGSGATVGTTQIPGVQPLGDGNFLVLSPGWNGAAPAAGAITLAAGRSPLAGSVQPYDSVRGTLANEGTRMPYDYDALHGRLAIGQPQENIVSLFTLDRIFTAGFE